MTGKMETPFYHDESVPNFGQIPEYDRYQSHKMMKKSSAGHSFPGGGGGAGLKLLQGPAGSGAGGSGVGISSSSGSLMPTADINLLKLSSPDLEHLIIQSNQGLVTTSPAPGGSGNPFLYRNQATNEQEGFADGFVKALADLHKQNQLVVPPSPSPAPLTSPYQRSLMPSTDMPIYTTLSSYTPSPYPAGQLYPHASAHAAGLHPQGRGPDAPQTVPEVPHPPGGDPCSSPPALSPIDLETQERIKAERKKLRNRIAASKCRKRKLERISRLEEKVKVLKTQNSDLASTAGILREQVAQLKQKVMNHVTSGCQISVSSASMSKGGDSGC